MLFEVMSQTEIRSLTRPHAYAVISITNPRSKRVQLRNDPNRVAALWRMFENVGTAYESVRDGRSSYFTNHDADAMLDFVAEHESRVVEIIVHCDVETSRSRGVALALAHIYGGAAPHLAPGQPNTHVVRALLERHAARCGQAVTMPVIVRCVKRCLWHIDVVVAESAPERSECAFCGARLEPVPVDIMTGVAVASFVQATDAAGEPHHVRATV